MKSRLSVYLEPRLLEQLEAYADRRGVSRSMVAEAAVASFLSPDAAERQEAALVRRLDRLNRHADRLERDVGIGIEMLAMFVRFWLTATPPLPEASQAAARAKGRERYGAFVESLGRRLATGRAFTREVTFELSDVDPDLATGGDETPA
ncbi:hypothetical protein KOAAANKH_00737 [Brevundimonas sp. NIBR10]|uniref:ribbon-helix-helix domain-containing protein n=1 Tax=Brevundimonas sp. NIBR10 TaxID=3015997 RepID=UPI0022F16501|nr:CopG family transcriptional regulator [Brevundimonas sp. NIBR10]WGM45872.1 hypothetical protein KOAAANKH_00737 [Brevundimonas sp. NIBR10]